MLRQLREKDYLGEYYKKRCLELKTRLKELEPEVLKLFDSTNILSLNAIIGSKYQDYLGIKTNHYESFEVFFSQYLSGWEKELEKCSPSSNKVKHHTLYEKHANVREFYYLFLQNSYLTHIDEYSRVKPSISDAEFWIGANNQEYGIFITPRLNVSNVWENDKSEIRKFNELYWTVGHILKTGIITPNLKTPYKLESLDQFMKFYLEVLIRPNGSTHQTRIGELYCDYLSKCTNPNRTPLLIPEYRFGGIQKKHKYRLDFLIINPITLSKIGFELSPWSTHGELCKTKSKTQREINDEALANWEKEIKKQREFCYEKGINVLIYSDSDLTDYQAIFDALQPYLDFSFSGFQDRYNSLQKYSK